MCAFILYSVSASLTQIFSIIQLSLLLKGTVVAPPDKFGKFPKLSFMDKPNE